MAAPPSLSGAVHERVRELEVIELVDPDLGAPGKVVEVVAVTVSDLVPRPTEFCAVTRNW